jgi:hypothetical protein
MSELEKEFVPYQESLELKELGFDEPCFAFYQVENFEKKPCGVDDRDEYIRTGFATCKNSEIPEHFTSAPLYQQAFRWFREKHNMRFCIIDDHSNNEKPYSFTSEHEYFYDTGTSNDWFSTYEKAELACLKKLIEIVKKNKI